MQASTQQHTYVLLLYFLGIPKIRHLHDAHNALGFSTSTTTTLRTTVQYSSTYHTCSGITGTATLCVESYKASECCYLVPSTHHHHGGIQQQQQPHPTPRGQGCMLLRRISSHPGRHDLHLISAFCSSCSTDKQRRQSRRSHLHRDPTILHQPQHGHGAHHDGNAPTGEGISAAWTEYCDPKRAHTNRQKQHA